MLPRRHRLTRELVKHTLSRGRRSGGRDLALTYRACQDGGLPQFSIVIPKKALSSAVARHRLKRRISAVLEQYVKEGGPCRLGVFHAGAGAERLSPRDLRAAVLRLLHGARL